MDDLDHLQLVQMYHQTLEVVYQNQQLAPVLVPLLLVVQVPLLVPYMLVVESLMMVLSTVVGREHLRPGLFLPPRFSRFNLRYFFFTTCKRSNT